MASDPRKSQVRLLVAVLTCGRPEQLKSSIRSLIRLRMPQDCAVTALVVDNDPNGSAKALVEEFAQQSGSLDISYVQEFRRGIPFGRNRAIDVAQERGSDLLCFLDDDEIADPLWLEHLVGCWRRKKAQLIGGPVYVCAPPQSAGRWQQFVNLSLQMRAIRKMRQTCWAAGHGKKYTIVTNNWLCDLHWQKLHQIRFDESLQYSGGSDTAFFRAAREVGCVTAWCPRAMVYEEQDLGRLSLRYQFVRSASQSINHYRMKRQDAAWYRTALTPLGALVKFTAGMALLVVPVYGYASPVIAVRSIGWSWGRMRAMAGGTSSLYREILQ